MSCVITRLSVHAGRRRELLRRTIDGSAPRPFSSFVSTMHAMRRKLQWLVVSRLVITGLLLVALQMAERESALRSFVPVLLALCAASVALSVLYYLAFRARVSYRSQAYLQLSIDIVMVTWLVYRTGDVESPFLALYLVIIFAASALLGRRGVSVLGVMSGVLYISTSLLTMSAAVPRARGWLPYESGGDFVWAQFMFSLNLIAIFGVAVLSGQLAERLSRSESQLATATRDLADYRLFNDRIIESMRSGLVTTDLGCHIMTFNRAAEEITG